MCTAAGKEPGYCCVAIFWAILAHSNYTSAYNRTLLCLRCFGKLPFASPGVHRTDSISDNIRIGCATIQQWQGRAGTNCLTRVCLLHWPAIRPHAEHAATTFQRQHQQHCCRRPPALLARSRQYAPPLPMLLLLLRWPQLFKCTVKPSLLLLFSSDQFALLADCWVWLLSIGCVSIVASDNIVETVHRCSGCTK